MRAPGWTHTRLEIKRESTALHWFKPLLIPGLLQAREYARAVLAAAHPASPGPDGRFAIASFDGPDVVYLDNALAGQVVERPAELARAAFLYDILKAEALSPGAWIQLARKAIEQWT